MALAVLRLAPLLLAVTFAGSARSGPGERGPPEKSGRGSQASGGPCPAPGGVGDASQTVLSIDYQDVPDTLTLCVAVTCPLMPMNVLCA
ncbi:SPINK2 isoform 4 [Pongo abelii]|uniref:SPINK2 isoform 4 n=1 Tax=Pongo abelii TaxID=9601 RepID=A0A2J8S2K5_PONAB|nr:SPINK2 isoform 4 [Pongo abelii]